MSLATLKAESKKVVRRPCAKVRITWTDPLIDPSLLATVNDANRINYPSLVADLVTDTPYKWLHTNDTTSLLDGTWHPAPSDVLEAARYQLAWWGQEPSDDGPYTFTTNPVLTVTHQPRLVIGFKITGDTILGQYPVDFTVSVQRKIGEVYFTIETKTVTGNTLVTYEALFNQEHKTASRIVLTISKWSHPFQVVKISEFYTAIIREYEDDEILYMNILEEFQSSDGTLPVGNISCNELDLKLQNITDWLVPANTTSDVHTFIKRNRKIEPFVGFEYSNGTKEYVAKGLYWSGDWSISDRDTGAQTTARDRFDLMRKDKVAADVFPIELYDVTVYDLLEILLNSLLDYLPDLYYDIDTDLSAYTIPVVLPQFFAKKSYFDALKMVVSAGLAYAYMDTPTAAEITEADSALLKDILRIKTHEKVFPTMGTVTDADEIEARDFIERNQPANTEEISNIVQVTYKTWEYTPDTDPLKPGKWEATDTVVEARDEDSISANGRLTYEYNDNDLVQTEELAQDIADVLVASYSVPRKDIELLTFGDITHTLAEAIDVPEYQKKGLDIHGIYIINKMSTQFDGGLRMTVNGRKLSGDVIPVVYRVIQDTDGATDWQDTDGATDKYQDAGV